MQKKFISWSNVEDYTHEIIRQISCSRWQPDYVVGITHGGLTPAMLISQWFGCTMHTLDINLQNGLDDACESNLWMAEDAFGYNLDARKNILIVNDINNTGATLNWLVNDWQSGCLPNDPEWSDVWNNNVRFASLYDKLNSDFVHNIDYCAADETSDDDNTWIVFPWEQWWINR